MKNSIQKIYICECNSSSILFYYLERPKQFNCISLFLSFILILLNYHIAISQVYYAFGNGHIYDVQIIYSDCFNECVINVIGPTPVYDDGVGFCPNGNLYGMGGSSIVQIDPFTGNWTLIMTGPGIEMEGFACSQDSTFYSLGFNGSLYLYNILAGTVTLIGFTGFIPTEDLTLFDGEYYFSTLTGIVHLDILNPSNSTLIVTYPLGSYNISGISASELCNTLVGINTLEDEIVTINLSDGSITHICTIPDGIWYITAINEFIPSNVCEIYLDLDCNDSSGATEADYNSLEFDCLSDPEAIADEDIKILIDAAITEMAIELIDPLPNDPYEFLVMTGGVAGISATGSGTTLITLTNEGGAKMTDFKEALHLIFYDNSSIYPTAGLRTIEVQFTTASGMMSNIAIANIQVTELPIAQVDLGSDQEICEGETATFNAGHPGATYVWSNGQTTPSINVSNAGQYAVTVSNGFECPGQDTAMLFILPVIDVSLGGDVSTCDNEPANLIIISSAPFPIQVDIMIDPGSPIIFPEIEGEWMFTDQPANYTEYIITNVIPSQPACVTITDPFQAIDVYPTYDTDVFVSLCDGDSIWLGFYWESEAGIYENTFSTSNGCDSFVITTINILPAENIFLTSSTCDSSEAGVFYQYLPNPNGCDTVVQTTVTLMPSDTTAIHLTSCNMANTGLSILTLTNQQGCDSLVITTTDWIPPSDTTTLYQLTCDTSQLGVLTQILQDQAGCDSLVITTVSLAPNDTTHIASASCDTAALGVFETLLSNQQGCDSLVITTVSPGTPDTTQLFTTSCDSTSLGVFTTHYTTAQSCDSTVITSVSFSVQDSVFIAGSTCEPIDTGVFISTYVNQFGCDSIVTETVSLLPSDDISIQSSTCDLDSAGTFITTLVNQHGCDSTITEIVALNPSDEIFLFSTTCNSSEAGVFVNTLTNQYGCDSVITETISLLPSDTTSILLQTCDPSQVGNIETMYIGADGCDSLVIESTTLYPLPELMVQSGVDYNGFDISCAGEADGSAIATVSGIPPYTYLWSTDDTDQMITGLSAGAYAVSVTDGNGCTTEGVITLTEPDVFMIGLEVSEPDCFDQQLGSITVKPIGGVAPYTYSIDGQVFQSSPDFTGLGEGIYQFTSLDANDCSTTEIISIDVPLMVSVELGDNQVISLGDSALLQAIINLPFDSLTSILWTGLDSTDCSNCLTQLVAPIITTAYSVSVTSVDGCADKDSLTVFVSTEHEIYVPNIFSPNGDGMNDELIIHVGDGVEEIMSFTIYDRWGNMVFLAEHIQANDPAVSWDGKRDGKTLNPGVFAYKLVAQFEDGKSEVRYGDITLIR